MIRVTKCCIASAHLHQVRSYGLSISSTNHFAPTPEINFADCDKSNVQSTVPLSEAGFLWTYANGQLVCTKPFVTLLVSH